MKAGTFRKLFQVWVDDPRVSDELTIILRLTALSAVLAGATVIVYSTGGTQHVWPHLMYFAVVLAGIWFGRLTAGATAVLAGLLMGPLMPLNVAAGIQQPTRGWLVRMGFYVAIGMLAGYARYRSHRSLERRRVFVSSVSHELRTPLAAVVGFAEVLEREWDTVEESEKQELIGHIHRESVEVAHVVDDLLVAARIDGGRLHIDCEQVDVRRIAESVLASLPMSAGGNRVKMTGSAQSWADPIRVRQIIRNLVTNAIAHGGDNVIIELRGDEDTAIVTVLDDGSGVPDIIVPRLFEPFLDRSDSPTTMPQSVGLGLAVSRELARRMGGRLSYCREDGRTVFALELPARADVGMRSEPFPRDKFARAGANSGRL